MVELSYKHVKAEYEQQRKDYKELLDNLQEMESMFEKEMISPEQLDSYKKYIEPIKNNYMRWEWFMFLLNKPNRKEKEQKYNKQFKKYLDKVKDIPTEHNENIGNIEKLKEEINGNNH